MEVTNIVKANAAPISLPTSVYGKKKPQREKKNHMKGKIGCVFAHRLALYFISNLYQTDNNIILEHDATLSDIE